MRPAVILADWVEWLVRRYQVVEMPAWLSRRTGRRPAHAYYADHSRLAAEQLVAAGHDVAAAADD